jgi:hypothetical protein
MTGPTRCLATIPRGTTARLPDHVRHLDGFPVPGLHALGNLTTVSQELSILFVTVRNPSKPTGFATCKLIRTFASFNASRVSLTSSELSSTKRTSKPSLLSCKRYHHFPSLSGR